VVHNKVQSQAAVCPGKHGRGEVLDPDAGVKELGLMAGDHQWRDHRVAGARPALGNVQSMAVEEIACGRNDLTMNKTAQPAGAAALEIMIPAREPFLIACELGCHLGEWWHRQQAAVIRGSPQAMALLHPRHPPATSSPALFRASWRTCW